jgi:hypothetical protein
MRNILLIVLLNAIFLTGAKAQGTDWKFYGSSDLSKSENVIAFYDAESIERLSDGNVKAWTKTISLSEVERITKVEEVSNKAERKIKARYVPPYILSNPEPRPSSEDTMKIIVWEEAANYDVIKAKSKALYELDCTGNKFRNISMTSPKKGGEHKAEPTIDEWTSIRSKSNAETLHNILCKQRDVIK